MSIQNHNIMLYNVENLFDVEDDPYTKDNDFLPNAPKKWDDEKFYTKLDRLSEVISAVNEDGPLLIGMVEVENKYVLEELINHDRLKDINYNIVHFDSPDVRGIDVALLYKEDFFTVLNKEPLPVHLENNDKTRDILYVEGQIKGDESHYHVFVNHWSSRREGEKVSEIKRIAAAKVLRAKIDDVQSEYPDDKIIVMGDFNDYPDNNSIKKYLRAKNSHSISNDELFNLAGRLDEDDKGSYNYKGDWGMMDQMMVSKSMLRKTPNSYFVKQKGLKIFDERWVLYYDKKFEELKPNKTYAGDHYIGGYSDHLPIYIELHIEEKE